MNPSRFGKLLVDSGVVIDDDVERRLDLLGPENAPLDPQLVELALRHERQLCSFLARRCGHPALILSESTLALTTLNFVPQAIAQEHRIFPVSCDAHSITLGVASLEARPIYQHVAFSSGRHVNLLLVVEPLLAVAIGIAYQTRAQNEPFLVGLQSAFPTMVHLEIARLPPPEVVVEVTPTPQRDAMPRPMSAAPESAAVPAWLESGPIELSPSSTTTDLPGDENPRPSGQHISVVPVARRNMSGPATGGDHDAPQGPVEWGSASLGRLALKRVASSDDKGALGHVPTPASPSQSAPPPAVLIVEDDDAIRHLLRQALTHEGHRVRTAATGLEGVERVREETPSLVVLDAMLPGMHGFEFCARMKSSERYRAVPIIMVSAQYRGWQHAKEIQEQHGADAFVEKPFDIRFVQALVGHMLGRSSPAHRNDVSTQNQVGALRLRIRDLMQGECWYEAIQATRTWLDLTPFDPLAHIDIAVSYTQLGQDELAMQALERAVIFGPHLFAAHANLGRVYDRLGFLRKANETWRHALRLAPDLATRDRITERLALPYG